MLQRFVSSPCSAAHHLIRREGFIGGNFVGWGGVGGWAESGVGGGGQRTLHIKGYTELSVCLCFVQCLLLPTFISLPCVSL